MDAAYLLIAIFFGDRNNTCRQKCVKPNKRWQVNLLQLFKLKIKFLEKLSRSFLEHLFLLLPGGLFEHKF